MIGKFLEFFSIERIVDLLWDFSMPRGNFYAIKLQNLDLFKTASGRTGTFVSSPILFASFRNIYFAV